VTTWVRNAWYVAGWDAEIDRAPLARTVCGVPMVFYRKLDRTVVGMRDACPHRMLPLSKGLREGDSIRCRYHGLRLGPDGVAEEMPIKTDAVNTRICAETFAIVERHRLVWVWVGDKDKADADLIPDLWPCSRADWVFDGGYYHVAADYRLMIDNLMDLTHETYVHSGSIGQPELMEAPIETRVEGDRAYVTRWMPGIDAPPFWRGALKQDGPVDRWQICEFIPPAAVMIDVGVAPVGAGATLIASRIAARSVTGTVSRTRPRTKISPSPACVAASIISARRATRSSARRPIAASAAPTAEAAPAQPTTSFSAPSPSSTLTSDPSGTSPCRIISASGSCR